MAHLFRLPEDANFGAVGGDAHTPKSTKEADAHCTALLVALLEATVNQPIKPKPGGTQKKLGFKPASKPSGGPMAGNRIAVEGRAVNAASRGTGGGDAGGGGGGDGGDGIQIFGEIHVQQPPVREESAWQCFECQHANKPHYQFCEHCFVGLPPKAMTDVNRVNGSVETGDGVLDTSGGGVDADSIECIVITDDDDDLDRSKETDTSPVRGHMIIVSEDDAESEDDDEDSDLTDDDDEDSDLTDGDETSTEDVDYFAIASYPRQPVEALDLEEVKETLTQMRVKHNVELKELGSAVDFVWRVRRASASEEHRRRALATYAHPTKGPAARANHSKAKYGRPRAGPPGESKDERLARVEGLLERAQQRAMTAQPSPGNINWPEEDDLLVIKHVQTVGDAEWLTLAEQFGGRHPGASCRGRWMRNLDPDGPRSTGGRGWRTGRVEFQDPAADELELKRQRRMQSNRESQRRRRLRKQAECEELGSRVGSLTEAGDA